MSGFCCCCWTECSMTDHPDKRAEGVGVVLGGGGGGGGGGGRAQK